ncbi:MAG: hypothetical protein ACPGR2_11065 [Psychrobium sp.]
MNFSLLNPYGAYTKAQSVQSLSAKNEVQRVEGPTVTTSANTADKVTLSDAAKSGATTNANDILTYEHLGKRKVSTSSEFLTDAMAAIVEGRLGVDKEKIKEIEAMMEEVGKDESLSAQEKEKRIAQLQEMLDKEYEKAAEKQAHQPIT